MNPFSSKKSKLIAGLITFSVIVALAFSWHVTNALDTPDSWWEVQSVDTMKVSRDMAREALNNPQFDETIDFQMKNIADLGATHVAIGTPYDKEFLPILKRWVSSARKNNLKVWFRGNFSGWEEWFDYPGIGTDEHIELLEDFLKENGDLFEDGDIFTSCPECENGAIGDPRHRGNVRQFREFLIEEYDVARNIFKNMKKDVKVNYYSMNGDVAKLVMNKETTLRLDGIIVVDHYVKTPEQTLEDIRDYAESSGGKVVLGEIGVPIPDIHGRMTEDEKAAWLYETLTLLAKEESVIGINYWVFSGGSTALWTDSGEKKSVADTLSLFYKPKKFTVKVSNEVGGQVREARVLVGHRVFTGNGSVEVSIPPGIDKITVMAEGYKESTQLVTHPDSGEQIVLKQERETILFKILASLRKLLGR